MPRRKLQLKHIEVFRAVVAGGSASEAGRQLGLTQPAVSKIIIQAEDLIGIPLFDRHQGRLSPTPKALALYQETNVLFSTLENLELIVERVTKDAAVPIAFGTVPLLATALLPSVLPDWLDQCGQTLTLHTHDGVDLLNLVAARQIEIALVVAQQHMDGVESRVIARSLLYCAIPLGHPLVAKKVIVPEDLHAEPYIGLSRAEGIQTGIDRIFLAANTRPREVMQVALMASAVAMAEAGAGLTLVDAFGMKMAKADQLIFRPFSPQVHFEYRAIWPRGYLPAYDRNALLGRLSAHALKILNDASALVGLPQCE